MQTKFCKHCRSVIAKNAKKCPFCGKKVGDNVTTWVIIGIFMFFVIVIGFGSSDNEPKSVETSASSDDSSTENVSSDSDSTKKSVSKENKKEFSQNEIIEYKGVKFHVANVTKSQGSRYDKPHKGKEFIIITLKIVNESGKKYDYNEYDWKMTDSTGNEEGAAFTTIDNDTNLSSGSLDSGGSLQRTIVFEKNINDQGLKLRYYDNMFDDDYTFQVVIK